MRQYRLFCQIFLCPLLHRCLLFFLCCTLMVILPSRSLRANEASVPYILAVIPQLPPVTMHTNWTPFVQRLTKETGLQFTLKVYDSMDSFEEDFIHGAPDFVYTNPTQMVLAKHSQGYVSLVRDSKPLAGYLFVRKDSLIKSADDLPGKTIAFVGAKNL
jgi:phosphonate transport system substrate-binding protein